MEAVRIPMEQLADILLLQLKEGGRAELTVTGSSMLPMLRHRKDRVVLIPGTPKKKDVILYKRDSGQYILHRIVRIKSGTLICCGDNQWQREVIRPEQALAVVDSWYRNGKPKSRNGFGYKLYVWLWTAIFPLRRPILAVRRFFGKIRRKLKKRKN